MSEGNFNQHKRVSIQGEIIIDDTIPLDVVVTNTVTIDDSTPIEVSDTTGTKDINLLLIKGENIRTDAGNVNVGVLRVTIADNDLNQSAIKVATEVVSNTIATSFGLVPTNLIALGAHDGANLKPLNVNGSGELIVTTAASGQDMGAGNSTANTLRVVNATDDINLAAINANILGAVSGTTPMVVNVAELKGVSTELNIGNATAGTLRVVNATDDPNLSAIATSVALLEETWDNIALGLIPKKIPYQIALQADNVTSERIIMDDNPGPPGMLVMPLVGTASSIASEDNAMVDDVIIMYYTARTDTAPVMEQITLTGNTPVALANNFYRPYRMLIAPGTVADNAAKIYVGNGVFTAGVPAVKYDFMPDYLNSHFSPFIFVPTDRKMIFDNILINSDINGLTDVIAVTSYAHPTNDVTAVSYSRQNFINQSTLTAQRFYAPIQGPATFSMTVDKRTGAGEHDIRVILNTYLYDTS